MFEIKIGDQGKIVMAGRFDASQASKATAIFDAVNEPAVVDMEGLKYISSLGLGILLKVEKRLKSAGGSGLKLINVGPHINDIFRYSGFSQIFDIETR
jgi:anti-anti-sigma factor